MTDDIRLKSISFMDMDDGTHACPYCKVQLGEGEDHCLNCALCEAEYEIEKLKNTLNEWAIRYRSLAQELALAHDDKGESWREYVPETIADEIDTLLEKRKHE